MTEWGYKDWGQVSRKQPPLKRFIKKIKLLESGCWEWTAAKSSNGYGLMLVDGKTKQAHRVAYELFVGPVDRELAVHHTCHKKDCVNPAHLELLTYWQNLEESISKRRKRTYKTVWWATSRKTPIACDLE